MENGILGETTKKIPKMGTHFSLQLQIYIFYFPSTRFIKVNCVPGYSKIKYFKICPRQLCARFMVLSNKSASRKTGHVELEPVNNTIIIFRDVYTI